MSSTLGLSTHDAVPFPLLPRIPRSDYTTVEVLHKVNIGGDQFEKRKATLFKLNEHDKELIADVMLEFRDACGPSLLSLTTGPLRYAKFRELLEDPFRSEYDDVRTANNHPNTVAGFDQTMQSFMERYFVPTDYMDQRRYLQRVSKPFKLSVTALASRLRKINKLMSIFNNNVVPYNENDLKLLFYPMMLAEWKQRFAETALEINDDAVTFQRVIRYMTIQETAFNVKNSKKRDSNNTSDSSNKNRCDKKNKNKSDRNDNNDRRDGSGRSGGRGGGRGGRGGRGGGRGGRGGQRNGDCPFPGHHHKWADCYGNPQGRNYRPGWELNPNGPSRPNNNNNTTNRNNNNRNDNQDAHVADEPTAAPNNNNNNNNGDAHWFDEVDEQN